MISLWFCKFWIFHPMPGFSSSCTLKWQRDPTAAVIMNPAPIAFTDNSLINFYRWRVIKRLYENDINATNWTPLDAFNQSVRGVFLYVCKKLSRATVISPPGGADRCLKTDNCCLRIRADPAEFVPK